MEVIEITFKRNGELFIRIPWTYIFVIFHLCPHTLVLVTKLLDKGISGFMSLVVCDRSYSTDTKRCKWLLLQHRSMGLLPWWVIGKVQPELMWMRFSTILWHFHLGFQSIVLRTNLLVAYLVAELLWWQDLAYILQNITQSRQAWQRNSVIPMKILSFLVAWIPLYTFFKRACALESKSTPFGDSSIGFCNRSYISDSWLLLLRCAYPECLVRILQVLTNSLALP